MADAILQTTSFEGMGIRALYPKELVSCLYAEDNNNLAALEPSISGNDVIISFPQSSSGSSNSFKFNESFPFISQTFVQYNHVFTHGANSNAETATSATQFPAYHLNQDLRYQVSGTEQQIIYGESMVDYLAEIVELDEKRNRLFELAGTRVVNLGSVTGVVTTMNFYQFLPLPWSDPKAHRIGFNTKPFGVYRCQNGLEIIHRMRAFATVWTMSGASVLTSITGSLFFKYHKVANPMMEKKIKFAYPFQAIRNLQTITLANQTTAQTISLNGFSQGQTTALIFHVAQSATDIYQGLAVNNVRLLFNGKVVYQSNNAQDEMWDVLSARKRSLYPKQRVAVIGAAVLESDAVMANNVVANTNWFEVDGAVLVNTSGAVSATVSSGRQYYYVIPIAETRLSEYCQMGEFSLGGNFSKESLQLQLTVPWTSSAPTLFMTYVYSGVYYFSENREVTLSW